MCNRIRMIQCSSIAPEVVAQVQGLVAGKRHIPVSLDSNHTRDHVLAELEAYAPLTSVGSSYVVFDAVADDTVGCCPSDRPGGQGQQPQDRRLEYLKTPPSLKSIHRWITNCTSASRRVAI